MTDEPVVRCVHCREPVETKTFYGQGGTKWIHVDGYMVCRSTYASPNLIAFEREKKKLEDTIGRQASS